MTFDTYSDKVGRQPASILELDLDGCSRIYGVSPCTADLALQNLAVRSDEIDHSVWTKSGVTVTANQDTHPIIGGTIVDAVYETAVTAQHRFWDQDTGLDPTKTYTFSAVVKGINRSKFRLRVWNNFDTANAFYFDFDTENLVVGNPQNSGDGVGDSAKMYALGDGYFRLIATGIPDTLGGASDGVRYDLYLRDDTGVTSYLGDVTKGAYCCAMQLREGS